MVAEQSLKPSSAADWACFVTERIGEPICTLGIGRVLKEQRGGSKDWFCPEQADLGTGRKNETPSVPACNAYCPVLSPAA
jgi:hypothetical protein